MHDEPTFADLFLRFLLTRSMRTQADLVDQLFNSSEKRLARILLLMAEFGKPGERETFKMCIRDSQQSCVDKLVGKKSAVVVVEECTQLYRSSREMCIRDR